MNNRVFAPVVSLLLVVCVALFVAPPAQAQAQAVPVQRGAKVINETHHELSAPLRDLVSAYGQLQPQPAPPRVAPLGRSGSPYSVPPGERDSAFQESEEGQPLVSTTSLLNFDGLTAAQSGEVAPPDTNAAVGTTQFVQTVNTAYEVIDKTTGHAVLGPTQIKVIFSGFGGACDTGPYFTDPIVLFDRLASRWVVSIAGSVDGFQTGLECVAVSTSSDATGSYYRYSFSFGNNFGDYPKLGAWPDAYYLTVNEFSTTGVLLGAEACALDRISMVAGDPATAQCFQATGVLYTFTGTPDGQAPSGGLVGDGAGNLYGVTYSGGTACPLSSCGTVFKVDPAGSETVVYRFTGGAGGATPVGGVIRDAAGNLYGTAGNGGNQSCSLGCGVVFKLDPAGNETVLYSFTGGADGSGPNGGLVRDAAGNLYGTTVQGGVDLSGTVFRVDPSGNETVLHSFTGGADGSLPEAGLAGDAAGNLYGTTAFGGNLSGADGHGVVFKVDAAATRRRFTPSWAGRMGHIRMEFRSPMPRATFTALPLPEATNPAVLGAE